MHRFVLLWIAVAGCASGGRDRRLPIVCLSRKAGTISARVRASTPRGSGGSKRRTCARLRFDRHGIAAVWMEGLKGFYYVGRDGHMVPVVAYDNGPDAFVEGRARTQVDGKIGYIDRKLRVVIPPRYDWGFPFEHGKAVVCSGCALKPDRRAPAGGRRHVGNCRSERSGDRAAAISFQGRAAEVIC